MPSMVRINRSITGRNDVEVSAYQPHTEDDTVIIQLNREQDLEYRVKDDPTKDGIEGDQVQQLAQENLSSTYQDVLKCL